MYGVCLISNETNQAEYLITGAFEHKNLCTRLDHISEMRILNTL